MAQEQAPESNVVPLVVKGKNTAEEPILDIRPEHLYPNPTDTRKKGDDSSARMKVGDHLRVPVWVLVYFQESVIENPIVPLKTYKQVIRDALVHRAAQLRQLGYDHPEWEEFQLQAEMDRICWKEETYLDTYSQSVNRLMKVTSRGYRLHSRAAIFEMTEQAAEKLPNGLKQKLLDKVDEAKRGQVPSLDEDDRKLLDPSTPHLILPS